MTVQKCCLTLGWDSIGWDNISPDVQSLGIDLSPVGENIFPDVLSLGIDLSPVGENVLVISSMNRLRCFNTEHVSIKCSKGKLWRQGNFLRYLWFYVLLYQGCYMVDNKICLHLNWLCLMHHAHEVFNFIDEGLWSSIIRVALEN